MRLKFDLSAGALYIRLADGIVARTREIDDNTNVDLDADSQVLGIEVISTRYPWPLKQILADFKIPAAEKAQLRAYFLQDAPRQARPHMPTPPMPAPPSVEVAPILALAAV